MGAFVVQLTEGIMSDKRFDFLRKFNDNPQQYMPLIEVDYNKYPNTKPRTLAEINRDYSQDERHGHPRTAKDTKSRKGVKQPSICLILNSLILF